MDGSTPTLSEFDPNIIPYQYQVIEDVRRNYDYSLGVHEVLLSGSVGSAKSLLMAHIGITHCLENPGAAVCIGRKSMPDLKDTIWQKIFDHMDGTLVEGEDYTFTVSPPQIIFYNGSKIICRSWSDKRYTKARSLELSALLIEELTENDSAEFNGFYKEYRARVGRLPHVKETIVMAATNPDSPAHAAYDYFIDSDIPTRHVYYSVTTDNPFLPEWYIEQLKETYTALEARRMIGGEWIEIKAEVIYYAFEAENNVVDDYVVSEYHPIYWTFDFNIGEGKPFSSTFFQFIDGTFYFFNEVVVHGARTEDCCDEAYGRGLLNYPTRYIINGDACGRHNDTRSKRTDYDIIVKYCTDRGIDVELNVPLANPPIRTRHNLVNGQLRNANQISKIKIDKQNCPTLIKGLRLTKLKKGGQYIEDDSDEWQHITTAAGYAIVTKLKDLESFNRTSFGRTS